MKVVPIVAALLLIPAFSAFSDQEDGPTQAGGSSANDIPGRSQDASLEQGGHSGATVVPKAKKKVQAAATIKEDTASGSKAEQSPATEKQAVEKP